LLSQRTTDGETGYTHKLNGLESSATPFGNLGTLTNTWLPNGSLASVELPNGSTIDHTFDDADRTTDRIVKNSSGTKLSSWESIAWDDNDNRTGETVTQRQVDGSNPAPGTAGYGYDTLDRLVSAKHPFESASNRRPSELNRLLGLHLGCPPQVPAGHRAVGPPALSPLDDVRRRRQRHPERPGEPVSDAQVG
jgi:hypothetical protein